ncbi:MAG: hypothetical protein ACYCUM_11990 [Solirubrobacteraceae bacterium]
MSRRTRSSRKRRRAADGRGGAAEQQSTPARGRAGAAEPQSTLARGRAGSAGPPARGRAGAAEPPARGRRRPQRAQRRSSGEAPIPVTPVHGQRPRPPWHPLPLAEILILVGAIALLIAFQEGVVGHFQTLLAGIAAVALGTLEVTLREHRSGFHSHTVLLSALPVLVFHSVTLLVVTFLTSASRYVNLGLFAVDLVLFVVLFRALRSTFLTARMRASGRG